MSYPFEDVWKEERERLARACEHRARLALEALARRAEQLGIESSDILELCDAATTASGSEWLEALEARGLSIEALEARLSVLAERAPYELLESDSTLERLDSEPFDPTHRRPRLQTARGTEVRGKRRGYVISSHSRPARSISMALEMHYSSEALEWYSSRSSMTYGEALEWTRSLEASGSLEALIGTEEYSWHQVVYYKPTTAASYVEWLEGQLSLVPSSDGAAPMRHGSGSSIVGRDAKKSRGSVSVASVRYPSEPLRSALVEYPLRSRFILSSETVKVARILTERRERLESIEPIERLPYGSLEPRGYVHRGTFSSVREALEALAPLADRLEYDTLESGALRVWQSDGDGERIMLERPRPESLARARWTFSRAWGIAKFERSASSKRRAASKRGKRQTERPASLESLSSLVARDARAAYDKRESRRSKYAASLSSGARLVVTFHADLERSRYRLRIVRKSSDGSSITLAATTATRLEALESSIARAIAEQ